MLSPSRRLEAVRQAFERGDARAHSEWRAGLRLARGRLEELGRQLGVRRQAR